MKRPFLPLFPAFLLCALPVGAASPGAAGAPVRSPAPAEGAATELAPAPTPLATDPPIAATLELQSGQGALLRWNNAWGIGYLPQYRNSLTVGSWSNLVPSALYEYDEYPEGTQQVIDRGARTAPTRFYRIVRVPEQ